ncbi:MAG: hypothetical protein NVS2B16_12000 [Chloroflexota bacterium]
MTIHRSFMLGAAALLVVFVRPGRLARAEEVPGSAATVFGMIGQVTNSAPGVTPAISIQYGYLTDVRGVEHPFITGGRDESSALFTFFTSATTTSVVTTGGFRTVTRTGTTLLYLDLAPHRSFTNPDTFRDGTLVQTSTMQQQVVINITTGAFRTVNINTITAISTFTLDDQRLQLGRIGDVFTTFLIGQLHSPPPPSGSFSGYALDGRGSFAPTSSSGVSAVPILTPTDGTGVFPSVVVSFPSAAAGDGLVLFGPGPGCTGLVEVATRDLFRHTTTHAVVVTGNDLPGTVGDNGIQTGTTYWYEVVTVRSGMPTTDDNHGACYQVTVPTT